ncbi:hypothetical protein SAMN05443574_1451 [Haloarcula vallismortis]|uniref:Uncharacterized protein n=2 Tax=Haloarcula vallismortis TaxID=28442 RepID=M0JRF5_HALVA|nr:hypothetical protein [Haloarcula vallismortis]EMA10255.1 hypothetical protein C437_03876 [Haloarcula vallismortis ATCC 29715]SDX39617.1 hypothetical protein SAMN05443574_1451 [Haloarcula vallismortis]
MNYIYTPRKLAKNLGPESREAGYVYITGDMLNESDIDLSFDGDDKLTCVDLSFSFDQELFEADDTEVLEDASMVLFAKVPREQLSQEALREIGESPTIDK